MKKKEHCLICGKETDEIYIGKNGFPICGECYLKELNKARHIPMIEDLPFFQNPSVSLPNRLSYQNVCEYCMDYLYALDGSDLHLKTNAHPTFRKGGRLYKISNEILKEEDILSFAAKYYDGNKDLNDHLKSIDFSFDFKDIRFRCNSFYDDKGLCLSLRSIRLFSTDFSVLGLPNELKEIVSKKSGMIIVTGPTGSGKSTSLAALVNYLNYHTSLHIITIEDPIEFTHPNKGCLISQREIGRDCGDYDEAIIELLREDPDVIVIGEMRDKNSIQAALRAVETGHLVLSTLHTRGCISTITRIVESFSPSEQSQIQSQLSNCLLAVCSQQLVPSVIPGKVHLATEFMINDAPIRACIHTNNLPMLQSNIQSARARGMYTMRDSLQKLLNDGKISQESFNSFQIN